MSSPASFFRRSAIAGSIVFLIAFLAARGFAGSDCEWTVVPAPATLQGSTYLTGVDAFGPDDAWAAGPNFMIHWDGSSWNEVALPDLSTIGISSRIDAMLAVPGGDVYATGLVVTSGLESRPMSLRLRNGVWDRVESIELHPQTVVPFAPRKGTPEAMTATGPSDVWMFGLADGNGDGLATSVGLALHFDGSDWTEFDLPQAGNRHHDLTGADQLASDDVWAVGTSRNNGEAFRGVIYRYDGSDWSIFEHPAPFQSFFLDVVTLAPDDVWIVGEQPGGALFMHWDGSDWTLAPSPVATTTKIKQVAAIASDDIWAVSAFEQDYYHYDGVAWTLVPGPEIPGATSISRDQGMVAVGPCDVWSVGSFFDTNGRNLLTERLRPGTPPAVDITLVPVVTDVAPGESIVFDVVVRNTTQTTQIVDAWLDVIKPNGMPWTGNPIAGPKAVSLAPDRTITKTVSIRVPSSTPPSGPYTMTGSVGMYPSVVDDASSLTFRVIQ